MPGLALIEPQAIWPPPITLGTDKCYEAGEFVMELHESGAPAGRGEYQRSRSASTPHPVISATRLPSVFAKRAEHAFGWPRQKAGCAKMSSRIAQGGCPRPPTNQAAGNCAIRSGPQPE